MWAKTGGILLNDRFRSTTRLAHALAARCRAIAATRSRLNIVVIGNGMVGHRFCEALVDLNAHKRHRIVVFGEEPRPAYDRINLTRLFKQNAAEPDDDALALAGKDWYAKHRILLHTGDPIQRIDRDVRLVRSTSGREVRYDHLVLATGSRPYVPPIEGVDLPGVFVYRTIEDLRRIRDFSRHCTRAAVIGGGLLGLEAAQALMDLGLDTHIIEFNGWLMPQQLNEPAARVLERKVQALDVHIHLHKRTQAIRSDDAGLTLDFTDGSSLQTQMVIISAGIRARDELAKAAGLECDTAVAGIMVNDGLETSDPAVSAIGECAVHQGRIYGLAAPGYQMAQALAARLMGRRRGATFTGGDMSARLKLLGVNVAVFGNHRADGLRFIWQSHDIRRELIVHNDRVTGAVIVGPWGQIGALRAAIDRKRAVHQKELERFTETGDLWAGSCAPSVTTWADSATVCNCKCVTAGKLRSLVASGSRSVEQLAACSGASSVCGSCTPLLAELVGADPKPVTVPGWRTLAAASIVALLLATLIPMLPALPFSNSVQNLWHTIDALWRDSVIKQITGFTLLGLCVAATGLSLRKRIKRLKFGAFGWWRVAHAFVGLAALATLVAHTGFRMGHRMNFALMLTFVLLSVLGAAAGAVTAMESHGGRAAQYARKVRPIITWAHILLLLPLPLLLGFHIVAVYYF